FGARAAVLHSALSAGERVETWRAVRDGRIDVVIGTRSAVFAPLPALRMIIIDEEQEHTYKSESSPRYHARDVAKFRCVQHGAMLLLASATPSLESAYAARKGSYGRFDLPHRFNASALPPVIMADMRHELRNGNDCTISGPLRDEIEKNIDSGEQTILFLNRRGFHRIVTCPDCGEMRQCPHCSVSLTYHSHNRRMLCHYCGYSETWQERCAVCGGDVRFFGAGTQKVVGDLDELFPGVGVLRMDTDTTSYKGAHKTLLGRFAEERIPILVGTQMIAKGLHLSNVTLVGVISADMSLYVDDYRANERTFDLITQVIGRAGRGDRPGRAVIQTFSTAHPVLLQAAEQDYNGFFENEIALREQQGYPPFGEMIMLSCCGPDQDALLRVCMKLRARIDNGVGALGLKTRIFGPAPAAVHKINNRYRYHITLCGPPSAEIRRFVATLLRRFPSDGGNKGVTLFADLHPNGF
ncbi:MAG: primosomal protein N', partial [Oscillospiraceae bacterium]|nr:primosomal protein N' [Oscillospiraceae bacterium]